MTEPLNRWGSDAEPWPLRWSFLVVVGASIVLWWGILEAFEALCP